jgi:hypothetical protein
MLNKHMFKTFGQNKKKCSKVHAKIPGMSEFEQANRTQVTMVLNRSIMIHEDQHLTRETPRKMKPCKSASTDNRRVGIADNSKKEA